MTEKQVETPDNGNQQMQIEAFTSKEAQMAAALDGAIANAEAESAEIAADKPEGVATPPVEPKEALQEAKTEPETPSEEPTEPKLSARERLAADFSAAADKEEATRADRQEAKEWRSKYEENQAELAELRAMKERIQNDPLGHFDQDLPADTYEKLTHQYAKGEKPTPQSAEIAALRKDFKALREELSEARSETKQSQDRTWIANHMLQVDQLLATNAAEYQPIHDYLAEVKKLTGEDTNIHQGIAKIFDEMIVMSNGKKRLTPRECLEIMKEDSEERISGYRPEQPKEAPKEPKRAKKPAKATLTNEIETDSESVEDSMPDHKGMSKDEWIQKVVAQHEGQMWQGNTEK